MKAIICTSYGLPDVLKLTEIAIPIPRGNEVLIKIHATSVNSWDWELLRGTPFVNRLMFGLRKPKVILGCDIAGRVEAVGNNVKRFKLGDEVFGDLSASGWGGFAEYVSVSENALAPKPDFLTFEQAAAVPQAGLLALQGLRYKGDIQPGQKVLINGASGGVGTFAIQIAKSYGAEVTGVCSTGKMELVRSLSADHVIDYTREDFTKCGQCYDLILDVQAHHSIFDYKKALRPSGVYVMVGGATARINQLVFFKPWISLTSSKKMGLLLHKANKDMALLLELLEAGKVVPVIDKRYSLSEVPVALQYFGDGCHKGKIIVNQEQSSGA